MSCYDKIRVLAAAGKVENSCLHCQSQLSQEDSICIVGKFDINPVFQIEASEIKKAAGPARETRGLL